MREAEGDTLGDDTQEIAVNDEEECKKTCNDD